VQDKVAEEQKPTVDVCNGPTEDVCNGPTAEDVCNGETCCDVDHDTTDSINTPNLTGVLDELTLTTTPPPATPLTSNNIDALSNFVSDDFPVSTTLFPGDEASAMLQTEEVK
jgi:hypothetical protein